MAAKNPMRLSLYLTAISTFLILLTILMGSLVHATGSSLACPDWPTCFGTYFPEMEGPVFFEHSHRIVAGLSGIFIWLAGFVYFFSKKRNSGQRWTIGIAMVLIVIQAVLGGMTVLYQLPDWISTTHFVVAHLTAAMMLLLTWWLSVCPRRELDLGIGSWLGDRSYYSRWASVSFIALFFQMGLGAWLRHIGTKGQPFLYSCDSFPICAPEWLEYMVSGYYTIYWSHRILAVLLTVGIVAMVWLLRRVKNQYALSYRLVCYSSLLVLVQIFLGELSVRTYLSATPITLHLAGALLLFCTLFWVFLQLQFNPPGGTDEFS